MSKIGTHLTHENLVHAYGIAGGEAGVVDEILKALQARFGIKTQGHPDVHVLRFPTMGIGEARTLVDRAQKRPLVGEKKFFILVTDAITREAQNALLKLFEEPTRGTHFFLIIPSYDILLPTLLSRLFLISIGADELSDIRAKKFLKATPSERLLLLKNIVEEKDKGKAIVFLNELESYIYKQIPPREVTLPVRRAFEDIERARSYLTDRAPSVKMLLEQVALSLPHKD